MTGAAASCALRGMNTQSVDCRPVRYGAFDHEGDGIVQVGDFCFDDDRCHLYVWLPGQSGPDAIAISREGGSRTVVGADGKDVALPVWKWDGNELQPTLTPSLLVANSWHGYLTAGRLVSC